MHQGAPTIALLLVSAILVLADEPTRRAQEELRKRNLYFGDINGQSNPEFVEAVKRYQSRKGFNPNGQLDEETASSLKIEVAAARNSPEESWPDLPVLKSDMARSTPEPDETTLQAAEPEQTATATTTQTPPPPPAESLTKAEQLMEQRLTNFVREYLRDAETNDVDLQLRYYEFPVVYFDHGKVDRDFVAQDTSNYVKRWPKRKYILTGPLKVSSSGKEDKVQVEFTIGFSVSNGKHAAHGKTRNFWTIQSERKKFKILAINEQRLHD